MQHSMHIFHNLIHNRRMVAEYLAVYMAIMLVIGLEFELQARVDKYLADKDGKRTV